MKFVIRRDISARMFGGKTRKDYYLWKKVPLKFTAKQWAKEYRSRSKGNCARVVKIAKGYAVYVR